MIMRTLMRSKERLLCLLNLQLLGLIPNIQTVFWLLKCRLISRKARKARLLFRMMSFAKVALVEMSIKAMLGKLLSIRMDLIP